MEQKYKLKKLVEKLKSIKGRHTELITVYVPQDYSLNLISNQLFQEQGTAANIKSASTRKNVINALGKIMNELKLFKKTPPNGLAVFCGNVSPEEGAPDYKLWAFEPPEPLKIKMYRCDQEFVLDPIEEMLEAKNVFGLLIIDDKDATIGVLKGKSVRALKEMTSMVPGKTRAGGQCLLQDTLVQLSNGEIKEIKEIIKGDNLKSCNLNSLKIENSKCTYKWKDKEKTVYKIITRHPRTELFCSKDHSFFVFEDGEIKEKIARELTQDDLLISTASLNIKGMEHEINIWKFHEFSLGKKGRQTIKNAREEKGLTQKELGKSAGITQAAISKLELGERNLKKKYLGRICKELMINLNDFLKDYGEIIGKGRLPEILSEELAQVIGYYVGDGSYEKDRISFSEGNKDLALYYKRLLNKVLRIKTSFRFRKNKNYYQLRVTSRAIARFFKEISKNEINKVICSSKNNVIASFLRGIFDAEGYTSGRYLSIGMNNKKVIGQIQMLFLRFGIISSLNVYDNKCNPYSNNKRYTLNIGEKKSIISFLKNIGFSSTIKNNEIRSILKNKSHRSNARNLIIRGSYLIQLAREIGLNTRRFEGVANNVFRDERIVTRNTYEDYILPVFLKRLNNIKDKNLKDKIKSDLLRVLNSEVVLSKINKIEATKEKKMLHDISVESENFIVNNIITHNSSQRFQRSREELEKQWFKDVGSKAQEILKDVENFRGLLIGGPGPTKDEFINQGSLGHLKNKIIGIKDIGYTKEHGLMELVDKSQEILQKEELIEEKEITNKFLTELGKDSGLAVYGKSEVKDALNNGVVETLLISETISEEEIDEFSAIAEQYSTKVEVISTETKEGEQLKQLGGFGAVLRYKI